MYCTLLQHTYFGTDGPVYDLLDAADETIGGVIQDAEHHNCWIGSLFDPLMVCLYYVLL